MQKKQIQQLLFKMNIWQKKVRNFFFFFFTFSSEILEVFPSRRLLAKNIRLRKNDKLQQPLLEMNVWEMKFHKNDCFSESLTHKK